MMDKCVQFAWVPAHVGLEGNEDVDILAKRSLKAVEVEIDVCLGKSEAKAIIKTTVIGDGKTTGTHMS